MVNPEQIAKAAEIGKSKYPRNNPKNLQYGTAGFREKAEDLPHVIYRMGLLAALRSVNKKGTIGIMVTASHNPVADNGVKLVDPSGEMLVQEWEEIATKLANASDTVLAECLAEILSKNPAVSSEPPFVFVGRDTRPSSDGLALAAKEGAEALGAIVKDFGLLTTPQLHFVTAARNAGGELGNPTEEGYLYRLSGPFCELWDQMKSSPSHYEPLLSLDGANGVGSPKVRLLQPLIGDRLKITLVNDGDGELNHNCGADHVKVQQKAPLGLVGCKQRGASLDGDADRIVYFYHEENGTFHLLDGDKIATLVAGYLQDLVSASGLSLQLGIVQTAYANGSSTSYITEQLKVPVACVPTGVKHLHHRAAEFDIGVYFEANGHGTVLFGLRAKEAVQDESLSGDAKIAAKKLSLLMQMINQSTGDALSDLLLVEIVLRARDWSPADWDNTYSDLPNRQLKVKVKDRRVVTTTDAERKCVSPDGLQVKIDAAASSVGKGRAFVRPSGTEDVVRVYAEAETQQQADQLANLVAQATFDLAGGTELSLIPQ